MNKTYRLGKKFIYIIATVVILLFGGLITFFAVRSADTNMQKHAVNDFHPVEINIAVHENTDDEPKPEKDTEIPWGELGSYYVADKNIKIMNLSEDKTNNAECYIRVSFVPHWVEEVEREYPDGTSEKFVVDTLAGKSIGDMKDIVVRDYDTTFDMGSVTYVLNGNWSQYWIYNQADGYFYYKYPVAPGEETTELLQKVRIPVEIYEDAYKGYDLRVDVLADAIQTEGEALDKRWVDAGLFIKEDGSLAKTDY